MIRTARILGLGAIALAAFGTAAGIASIGESDDFMRGGYRALTSVEPVEPSRVAAQPGTRCDILLPLGDSLGRTAESDVVVPLALSVPAEDSMDLDLPGSDGFSVACASGPTVDGGKIAVETRDARVAKADLVLQ